MHIGIVTPYYPDQQTINSGLATHFATLASALVQSGHQVTVLHVRPLYSDEIPGNSVLQENGITLHTYRVSLSAIINKIFKNRWSILDYLLRLKGMLIVFKNLNSIIKRQKIDVVETTSYYSLCYWYLKVKPQTVPIVIRVSTTFSQIMNDHYPFKSRLFHALGQMEIKMIQTGRHLVTHARNHAAELQQLYGVKADSFNIIPHGIVLPILNRQEDNNVLKVLFVGRMEYRKGIDVLLEAIPLVLKRYPDVIFELIGSDTNDAYQQKFYSENSAGVTNKVNFKGAAAARYIENAYSSCDIFVAPSRYESFGLIYIEAMSYGKPVIGCYVGGVPEIIEDGKNGLFAKVGDAHDLAGKILILLTNEEQRQQMGAAARRIVEDRFTAQHLSANSIAYYQKLIEQSA